MIRATHICLISGLVSVGATLPSLAVAAGGKYGWFNDAPISDDAGQGPSSVGVDVYRSGNSLRESSLFSDHKISLFGDYSLRGPQVDPNGENASISSRTFANFGVRWQHRVSASDSVSIRAEQGQSSLTTRSKMTTSPDASDTRATLAWTRDLPWAGKPSITGGVFMGDETARDETSRQLGRRYYGFTVGGELRLLEAHRPYVSFRLERSLYDINNPEEGLMTMFSHPTEDSSRIAAGWRWQANRDLSLQAEASYGMNFNGNSDLAPNERERERSRVFFGTRFDFR